MSSTIKKIEENPQELFNNLLNVYLENVNNMDINNNLEMEVRFGTRNINRITSTGP